MRCGWLVPAWSLQRHDLIHWHCLQTSDQKCQPYPILLEPQCRCERHRGLAGSLRLRILLQLRRHGPCTLHLHVPRVTSWCHVRWRRSQHRGAHQQVAQPAEDSQVHPCADGHRGSRDAMEPDAPEPMLARAWGGPINGAGSRLACVVNAQRCMIGTCSGRRTFLCDY